MFCSGTLTMLPQGGKLDEYISSVVRQVLVSRPESEEREGTWSTRVFNDQ